MIGLFGTLRDASGATFRRSLPEHMPRAGCNVERSRRYAAAMEASHDVPGPTTPKDSPAPSEATPPARSIGSPRLAAGIVLTLVVIAMPWAGAMIGTAQSGEPVEWDLVWGTS